mmetsp:Transcript_34331/g.72282  ORF Transcript_34331/g.72282 Transcript_34331/m.72282 type:complete len:384 (+) Transcript_34331:250-1401(+)
MCNGAAHKRPRLEGEQAKLRAHDSECGTQVTSVPDLASSTSCNAAGQQLSAAEDCPEMNVRAFVYGTKGRKHTMEDASVLVDCLQVSTTDGASCPPPLPTSRRMFYAVLDGHGGRDCADFVVDALPVELANALEHVPSSSSSSIKDGIRKAFTACDKKVLGQCESQGWADGCCVVSVVIDSLCSPPRAYVANLGDSRAYACVREPAAEGGQAPPLRCVSLSKDHSPLNPAERKRIEQAGGHVEKGRLCGSLEVSRSLGDSRLKRFGCSATPDVASFTITRAQRFLLLACDGVWRVFSGQQAVEWLDERLAKMDARRAAIADIFSKQAALTALTKEGLAALTKERDTCNEMGVLREMLHEAVHTRQAKDNCTALLIRFDWTRKE